jgi:hypothetical protein
MNIVGYLVQKFSGNKIRPKIKVVILTSFLIFMDFQKVDGQTLSFPYIIENVHAGGTTSSSTIISGYAREENIKLEVIEVISESEESKIDIEELHRISSLADGSFYFKNLITGLQSDSQYRYQFLLADTVYDLGGKFRTFNDQANSFKVIFGACAATRSERKVFETIMNENPICYINAGDFHYRNIDADCVNALRHAYNQTFNSDKQLQLYRSTSFAYVWDDHDFGPNNSAGHPNNDLNYGNGQNNIGTAPCTEIHKSLYDQIVSHYPLTDSIRSISQSFSIGRLRVLLTDLRSNKLRPIIQDCQIIEPGSNFGSEAHINWFKQELLKAKYANEVVAWVSSFPYINQPGGSRYECDEDDNWGGYPEERNMLASFISEHQIPLFMVSGDAHMLAIDDGTNSNYGNGDIGFPVFHVGALHQTGSVKGGPYSHGTAKGGGQYGLFELIDNGVNIEIIFKGMNENQEIVISDKNIVLSDTLVFEIPKKLNAPIDLSIDSITPYKVYLKWVDNSYGENGFIIERKVGDEMNFQLLDSLPPEQLAYIDKLKAYGNVVYRIKSYSKVYQDSEYTYSSMTEIPLGESVITNAIKVFPNPLMDNLYLEIYDSFIGNVNVEIFGLTGKSVFKESFKKGNTNFKANVNTRGLFYDKIYIVSVSYENEIQYQTKIIRSH